MGGVDDSSGGTGNLVFLVGVVGCCGDGVVCGSIYGGGVGYAGNCGVGVADGSALNAIGSCGKDGNGCSLWGACGSCYNACHSGSSASCCRSNGGQVKVSRVEGGGRGAEGGGADTWTWAGDHRAF